jgi:hypothetical protein
MDERTTVLTRALKGSMERETELFTELRNEIDRLRDVFQGKKWTASLTVAQGIERFAEKLDEADLARDSAFVELRDGLGLPRETTFSAILPRLPENERSGLEASWRDLRMSLVRLKTATSRMRYSAEALADTFNKALEEIFPHRKGKIYSRRGKTTTVNDAVLVDRKL